MIFSSKRSKSLLGAGVLAAAALTFGASQFAIGSDHADTVENVRRKGADLTDLHIFPSPNPNNVVLAMSVAPLIPAGQGGLATFDPNVLYQFKIDTDRNNVEDLVIQARFLGTGPSQRVLIAGPVRPSRTGTTMTAEPAFPVTGALNSAFSPTSGMTVFAGARSDPFFIDLEQFGNIFPDRLVPAGLKSPPPAGQENTPMAPGFRPPGQAQDFLANFNVLAIVVELPKAQLGNGRIGVWMTTSIAQ